MFKDYDFNSVVCGPRGSCEEMWRRFAGVFWKYSSTLHVFSINSLCFVSTFSLRGSFRMVYCGPRGSINLSLWITLRGIEYHATPAYPSVDIPTKTPVAIIIVGVPCLKLTERAWSNYCFNQSKYKGFCRLPSQKRRLNGDVCGPSALSVVADT